ncbi:MAG: stage II sporulation protein P [Clostridium sp.]|jgi:stage II sporulation protein P|uniref:stage II sporulation protein P n=1 Tax=Clostridium sp. TaxID=1506 RepID=UPI0025C3D8C8|nr:stage II sporulation protein P [Clostridium sp.]MCH3963748.1 stage II sporulation protein P [Clostridium sp.]MCI1714889.1 stage II sporulation protein P [Clostridium sp.]MCI1798922.1 stage II sporulation protein P [Clostridium sp.]MCI1813072.1 stage II sporulation protein P [Clostridium sp.]MCI1869962.1 stage II sporulation protein P [Clostridium sp.]
MNYRKFSRRDNPKLEILTLIISLVFVIILPYLVEASNNTNKNVRGNMFYVQVLNYAMPAVKATCFNEDDMAENSFSLDNSPLEIFSINIRNPLSILGREMAFLGLDVSNNSIDEFKLDNKQVAKAGDSENLSRGSSSTTSKGSDIFDPSLKRTMNKEKPDVLIYHTHTTESYKPGGANSFDDDKNVCAVGDQLVAELNKYGISAINDKTVHDAEAYTQSYARSSVTLDKYLKKYGDFKLIIDMHRDATENKNSVTMNINGENISKFMLVMARKNPHFDKNMALANQIVNLANQLYPGLSKGVCYYNYGTRYFNQDKSNNAILLEVGADLNTTEESKASMKYMARILAQIIK